MSEQGLGKLALLTFASANTQEAAVAAQRFFFYNVFNPHYFKGNKLQLNLRWISHHSADGKWKNRENVVEIKPD